MFGGEGHGASALNFPMPGAWFSTGRARLGPPLAAMPHEQMPLSARPMPTAPPNQPGLPHRQRTRCARCLHARHRILDHHAVGRVHTQLRGSCQEDVCSGGAPVGRHQGRCYHAAVVCGWSIWGDRTRASPRPSRYVFNIHPMAGHPAGCAAGRCNGAAILWWSRRTRGGLQPLKCVCRHYGIKQLKGDVGGCQAGIHLARHAQWGAASGMLNGRAGVRTASTA